MRLSCSRTLRRTWFLAFVLLAGCAYNPSDHYDPDAIEKRGLIVAKKVARTEPVQSGETNPPLFLPLPGVLVVLPARPIESTGRMNVYLLIAIGLLGFLLRNRGAWSSLR